MANLLDCFLELQKRVHRFTLVCDFRVRRAVRIVSDALVKARIFEMQRTGVRTRERKEVRNGIAAFQVDNVGVAPARNARRNAFFREDARNVFGNGLSSKRDFKVVIALWIRNESAA